MIQRSRGFLQFRDLRVVPLFEMLLLLMSLGCASSNLGPFELQWTYETPFPAGLINLDFDIFAKGQSGVTAIESDHLFTLYENKLHAYIFDSSLSEFQHVHPVQGGNGSGWRLDLNIERDGHYFLWLEGTVNGPSQPESLSLSSDFDIVDGLEAWEVPASLAESLSGADGDSSASIRFSESPTRGKSQQFLLEFRRLSGAPVGIGTYLGASVHLTGAHLGTGKLSHTHGIRIDENGETKVILEGYFPESGDYRLWAQYVDGEILRTVPFTIHVN